MAESCTSFGFWCYYLLYWNIVQICLERCNGLQTYPDIGQAAFGFFGRICIAVILYIELFSSCVSIHLDSYMFCAIISTLVILPRVWLRNLSLLSYISAGVVTLAAVVVCLVWPGELDGVEYHPSETVLDFGNFPVAVGLIGFCYGAHSVLSNIYTSMKEPSRFPSFLLVRIPTDWAGEPHWYLNSVRTLYCSCVQRRKVGDFQ